MGECVDLVLNVVAGGIHTTQAQLSHAMRLFAAHPGQWAALARYPGLVPAAVEEVLRFEPITPFTARICTDAIEHRGVLFPAGRVAAICAERATGTRARATSSEHHPGLRRAAADVRRGPALLPGLQPRPG